MASGRPHDDAANRIAKKYHAQYNKGPGADVQTDKLAVEIETERTVGDASRQLQGYQKPVYVVGTTNKTVKKALEKYQDTSIGIMDKNGNIIRRSKRGR